VKGMEGDEMEGWGWGMIGMDGVMGSEMKWRNSAI
jgi:hypothetical protein